MSRSSAKKFGLRVAGAYVALVVLICVYLMISSSLNAGDSGEGGVLLLPFVFPWFILIAPLGFAGVLLAVALNATAIYLIVWGLGTLWERSH